MAMGRVGLQLAAGLICSKTMDNIRHCQLINPASPYHTRSLLSSPSLHSLSGIRVSPSFNASIVYFVASFALNFSTPSFSYSLLHMEVELWAVVSHGALTGALDQSGNEDVVHEHVAILPALLSELFFHNSIVVDEPFAFVSWMTSCKILKQTSWRMYTSLRTFHRTWQLQVSARYARSWDLCWCAASHVEIEDGVVVNACQREWSERGWICARFYRQAMWF